MGKSPDQAAIDADLEDLGDLDSLPDPWGWDFSASSPEWAADIVARANIGPPWHVFGTETDVSDLTDDLG